MTKSIGEKKVYVACMFISHLSIDRSQGEAGTERTMEKPLNILHSLLSNITQNNSSSGALLSFSNLSSCFDIMPSTLSILLMRFTTESFT